MRCCGINGKIEVTLKRLSNGIAEEINMFNPDFSDAVTVIDNITSRNNTIFEVIEYKKPRSGSVIIATAGNTTTQCSGEKLRQVRIAKCP